MPKNTNKDKTQDAATGRTNVISFRVSDTIKEFLDKQKESVVGVQSANQMARKLVEDHAHGFTQYDNPEDATMDTDMILASRKNQ